MPLKHGPEVENCDRSTLTVQSHRADRRYLSTLEVLLGPLSLGISEAFVVPRPPCLHWLKQTIPNTAHLQGLGEINRIDEKMTRQLRTPCTRQFLYPCPEIYHTHGTAIYLAGVYVLTFYSVLITTPYIVMESLLVPVPGVLPHIDSDRI